MKRILYFIISILLAALSLSCAIIVFYIIFTQYITMILGNFVLLSLIFAVSAATSAALLCSTTASDKRKRLYMKILIWYLFVYYFVFLIGLLFFNTFVRRQVYGYQFYYRSDWLENCEFVPFRYIAKLSGDYFLRSSNKLTFFINIIGNIVATAPLGFFLPVLFEKFRKWHVVLLSVAAFITAVELFQGMFALGSCQTDDLILNLAGTAIIFAIYKIKPVNRLLEKLRII